MTSKELVMSEHNFGLVPPVRNLPLVCYLGKRITIEVSWQDNNRAAGHACWLKAVCRVPRRLWLLDKEQQQQHTS
jgi:hypothetical protein